MNVVITGATSMIGSELVKQCIENKCNVLAIVRPNSPNILRIPKSKYIKIAYFNLENLTEVSDGGIVYDVFYHLAWEKSSKENRNDAVYQAKNITYTLKAVELCKKLKCKKFIGAGSQAEYGLCREIINEDTQANPITSYGISKLASNNLSKIMCEQYGLTHIWARIFSVYGENDNDNSMLSYGIRKFLHKEIAEFSSATQYWNYLHQSDAGKIMYLLGETDIDSGIYCVANDKSMILKNYINVLSKSFDYDVNYNLASECNNMKSISLNVDASTTFKAVNFIPNISFEDGIKKMIKYKKKIYEKND